MQRFFVFLLIFSLAFSPSPVWAQEPQAKTADPEQEKFELYQRIGTLTGIPWYFLAGADRYERNIKKRDSEALKRLISIDIPPEKWAGFLNPNPEDHLINSIRFFNGIGKDGSGDQLADRKNNEDILFSFATFLASYGFTEDDIRIGLWEYYKRDKAVELISQFAQIYQTMGTIKLNGNAFPLPLHANYSYRSTWGDSRGWGGRRIHEGCDLFAGYGTPVRSVAYGYVEVKGWNRYGGWRVGIRDLNNVYHYYAHLGGFNKSVNIGDVVKPGDVIGWVGSSGYGNPGTAGKFPPHLHYGMYKDNGRTEWAFDPYPHLRKWEREEYQKKKKR